LRYATAFILAVGSAACSGWPFPGPRTPRAFDDLHPAHLQIEETGPGGSLLLIEVAGSYEEIGYAFGEWYRDRGLLPEILTVTLPGDDFSEGYAFPLAEFMDRV
jgi:hypothetical protein